jgi:hypothetical protein
MNYNNSSADEYDEDDDYEDVVYEENIEIDLTQAYKAFTKGLKQNWKNYLEELEENTFCDNGLDLERDSVIEAFSRMRSYMRNGSKILPTFDIFDLNNDLLKRIAYLIVQLENKSPKDIKTNFDFNNNNNNNNNNDKLNTKTTDESGFTSTQKSDEIYEEDFEVEEEYDNEDDNNEYDDYDIESEDGVEKVYDSTYDDSEEIDDTTIPYMKIAQDPGRFVYNSEKIVSTPSANRQIASAGRVSPASMKNEISIERRPHSTGSTPPVVNRSESTPVLKNGIVNTVFIINIKSILY